MHISDSILKSNVNSDTIFFQKVYNDTILENTKVAVIIGNIFKNKKVNAITIYSTSDSTLELNLYEKSINKWTLLQKQSIENGLINPSEEFIYLIDINNDNISDLLLLHGVYLMRSGEIYKAFFYNNNHLINIKGFEEYPNPAYDNDTKKLYSYMGTSCADMDMQFLTGVIKGDSVITEQNIHCDCCYESQDSCAVTINNKPEIKVKYNEVYKCVQPYFQDFLRDKLIEAKEY